MRHLGRLKRHLSGNQEDSVNVLILLLPIVVTLEPGKSPLYISVYPSTISLGRCHDKNANRKQQNCFDYHQYQNQIDTFTVTTGKQLRFVFREAIHPLFWPDLLWTPGSSNILPPSPQNPAQQHSYYIRIVSYILPPNNTYPLDLNLTMMPTVNILAHSSHLQVAQ